MNPHSLPRGLPTSRKGGTGRELKAVYDHEAGALKVGAASPPAGGELMEKVIIHFNGRGEPVEIEVPDAVELLAKLAAAVESAKRAKDAEPKTQRATLAGRSARREREEANLH